MRITRVYARFYRSFNFDYERKAREGSSPLEWELIDGAWFPFVRVDLDPEVTAVVGANESGKSQLIDIVEKALSGQGIERRDFCRYSSLFSVERDQLREPDLGVEFITETSEDVERAAGLGEGVSARAGRSQILLRLSNGQTRLVDDAGVAHALDEKAIQSLEEALPRTFRLETQVPIPDSMSFDSILEREPSPLASRRRRSAVLDVLREATEGEEPLEARLPALQQALEASGLSSDEDWEASQRLGRALLLDVARIDRSSFEELEQALRDEEEGRVDGLVAEMNRALARHLNFSVFWRQDRDFQLRLAPREREVVFTIRDRTGTDYSFSERSRGLTFFLSYFVQLRAHVRDETRREILLMDEPDAYLSSDGQQDLLRTLEAFARRGDERRDQVVYVTHSPFLLNKNAAHRIRVLDKGTEEEGTRVVRDVARNHYEPLRSALGAFVAETTFIGGTNLLVEGPSDQVFLAGMTSMLRRRGLAPRNLIDLNEVTVVPAGSASNIPYMTYLARGRDEIKPACVALLDGDEAGQQAARKLSRKPHGKGAILAPDYIVDVASWAESQADLQLSQGVRPVELEDLVPLEIACRAARNYAEHLMLPRGQSADALRVEDVTTRVKANGGRPWKALEESFTEAFGDESHIDKVGFAREVMSLAEDLSPNRGRSPELNELEANFAALLAELARRLDRAGAGEAERRVRRRLTRLVRNFLIDHPVECLRDDAERLLRDIEGGLEDTETDDRLAQRMEQIRRRHALAQDPLELIEDFDRFRDDLTALTYDERLSHQDRLEDPTSPPPKPKTPRRRAGTTDKQTSGRSRRRSSSKKN